MLIRLSSKATGLSENENWLTLAMSPVMPVGLPTCTSLATRCGQGIQSCQVRSRSDMAAFSQVRLRSPAMVNGRPIASLVLALSHGRALFQSYVSRMASAMAGTATSTPTTASTILVRRLIFFGAGEGAPCCSGPAPPAVASAWFISIPSE
jgi:hypothetical protein